MKFFPLLWATLWRRKPRTIFTMLSIVVAFLLFGMLQAVNVAFSQGVEMSGADRLITHGKYSFTEILPYGHYQQIRSVPGVAKVSHATWFGGQYQSESNFFPIMPVDQDTYYDVYPEFVVPDEQLAAFKQGRTTCIVGRGLIEKFGWKIGDTIPIQATIWPKKGGSNAWEFQLVGVMDARDETMKGQENFMVFRWDYFDEARAFGQGTVGWYNVKVANPAEAETVGRAIDKLFANSPKETLTETDKAFNAAFVKQFGDIQFLIASIIGASFFSLIIITGNTMMQSVRERVPELAVLKTLGFRDGGVLALVLAESALLCLIAAGVGVLLSTFASGFLKPFLPGLEVNAGVWMLALGAAIGLALLVGAIPSLRAMRLNIVNALSGH